MKILLLLSLLAAAPAPAPRSIRDVDFRNFSYPSLPTGKCSAWTVRVRGGRYEAAAPRPDDDCWSVDVADITYGDVTGDRREEAMVVLYAEVGGTEGRNDVFVYALRGGRPALLWKFATGDRAEGGLRSIYAEGGALVLELAGKDKFVGGNLYAPDATSSGACCPTVFTRTKYRWARGRFRRSGPARVLPFDRGGWG